MRKKYRLITYTCRDCGNKVKILINKDNSLVFSILDKLYSTKDVLSNNGYYVCVICHEKSNILKFEYIYG